MKRNYLLVYTNWCNAQPKHRYFETVEQMKDFIKELYEVKKGNTNHRYWKVLHKYEIKEVK